MIKNYIIIHHSATPDGSTFDWGAIRRYHTSWKCDGAMVSRESAIRLQAEGHHVEPPWSEIGYHWGLDTVGGYPEIIVGRFSEETGAHCADALMNKRGIGVCVVGNFDKEPPSEAVQQKLLHLVKWLMDIYGIQPENVLGHREAQAIGGVPQEKRKTCPGKAWDMDEFRRKLVSQELRVGA